MEGFEEILRIVTNYGLAVVMCVVLLFNLLKRDKKRDEIVDQMGKEIKGIQEHDRQQMMTAINEGSKAIDASNNVIEKFAEAFHRFSDAFDHWRKTWE